MHVHSKRVLHRDLKTQNIFISKGNIIKLGGGLYGFKVICAASYILGWVV